MKTVWTLLLCLGVSYLQAQLLASWDFENVSTYPSTPIDPSSMSSLIATAKADIYGGNNIGSPDVCSGNETWASNFWPTGSTSTEDDYLYFEITTDYRLYVIGFSFSISASSDHSARFFDVYAGKTVWMPPDHIGSGTTSGTCTGFQFYRGYTIEPGGFAFFRIHPYAQDVGAQAATIRIDNVTIYGYEARSDPLPVDLLQFQAEPHGKQVRLQWQTATEIQNDYFSVWRSENGVQFREIGKVNGHGTSSQTHSYEYWDDQAVSGWNYYQLRQTDFDGSTHQLPVRVVYLPYNEPEVQIYVPAGEESLYIDLTAPIDGAKLTITDLTGRPLVDRSLRMDDHSIRIPMHSWPPGMLLVQIKGRRFHHLQKVIRLPR